jgi:lipopolysaccharide transport system ATP-binding protein
MSDVALRMEHVYKMFRKGEVFTSLRDLIPALTGKMFRQMELNDHDKRQFWALQDLSFEVKRGEAFGIIGHNGAGKSTALKILSRIMKPTKGQFIVNGRLSALIEVTAGFHQDLTGRENIFLHGAILGMKKLEIASKLDQIIAFSGLEEFIDTPVKRYSSGMYARLGFSVAAHVNPDVMVVDEVLSVGDYAFQQKCVEHMKEVLRNGVAVVFVSHNHKNIAEFCSRCLLLEHGRTAEIGPVEKVIGNYMDSLQGPRTVRDLQDVVVSSVVLRDQSGPCLRFQSGQKAWVDIEITARRRVQKLSVSLYLIDSNDSLACGTSTERLGYGSFDLEAGEKFRCTFEVALNLSAGTFHVSTLIFRYDVEKEYDGWKRAATFSIEHSRNVSGLANCFPKIVKAEVLAGELAGANAAGPQGEQNGNGENEHSDREQTLPATDK